MSHNAHHTGLTGAQVEESRRLHGVNILTPAKKDSLLKKFLQKFTDPLIVILLIAGFLSIGISIFEYFHLREGLTVFFEPIGIFVAILLATGLAFIFEYKADKEFELLNKVNDDEPVEVIRNGNHTTIARKDVVVGDIVVLATGGEIPADGVLLEAQSLNVDESSLTGEPMAHKTVLKSEFDPEATFPSNHVMRGTKVLEGHGVMEVTAVGDSTENGKVFTAAQIDDSVKTPLNEQLDRLGKLITKISWGFAAAIVVGRMVVYSLGIDGEIDWIDTGAFLLQTLMIAVTLVVVAVPEGLPMAVTLSLAYSMRRMLKTNNLVRKMHACETMGATTVICTDKTGTLTQNRMQVAEVTSYDSDTELLEENMALNSTADLDFTQGERPSVLGNPTEGALLLYLHGKGVDYQGKRETFRRLDEVPFSTERKYMATLVENPAGEVYLFVKGAPEIVYGLCSRRPDWKEFDSQLSLYQGQAMRTLGFAYGRISMERLSGGTPEDLLSLTSDLIFQGIAAISDPVREEVPAAVREALDAGIRVIIVTGDTPGTAREIGRQVGLWEDSGASSGAIITGPEFEALSEEEVKARVKELKIIARARPLDKKRLVETLQAGGEVVAVTGDGTNDAPALKAAHVGLSMGDGTSVAKEASDITIIDNSFSSIGRAVMWGRSLYMNIRRFVLFQTTVNVAACFIVLVGAFLGTQSPLTVTQMLWVNLIMDTFAAMALAALPPSRSVMRDRPRDRRDFIINGAMWSSILWVGGIFFALLTALLVTFQHLDLHSLYDFKGVSWGENNGLNSYELSLFFTIFVFLQFWNMFNARAFATGRSALHLEHCGEFVFIALVILIGQILIVTFGGHFFSVTPLKVLDWVIIIGGTSLVLWIGELFRRFRHKKS